jgi:hypothetical protein
VKRHPVFFQIIRGLSVVPFEFHASPYCFFPSLTFEFRGRLRAKPGASRQLSPPSPPSQSRSRATTSDHNMADFPYSVRAGDDGPSPVLKLRPLDPVPPMSTLDPKSSDAGVKSACDASNPASAERHASVQDPHCRRTRSDQGSPSLARFYSPNTYFL